MSIEVTYLIYYIHAQTRISATDLDQKIHTQKLIKAVHVYFQERAIEFKSEHGILSVY